MQQQPRKRPCDKPHLARDVGPVCELLCQRSQRLAVLRLEYVLDALEASHRLLMVGFLTVVPRPAQHAACFQQAS